MDALAYLTRYDGLVCGVCAHQTADLIPAAISQTGRPDGKRPGLTAIPISEVLQEWPDACCEECKQPLALSAAWSA